MITFNLTKSEVNAVAMASCRIFKHTRLSYPEFCIRHPMMAVGWDRINAAQAAGGVIDGDGNTDIAVTMSKRAMRVLLLNLTFLADRSEHGLGNAVLANGYDRMCAQAYVVGGKELIVGSQDKAEYIK